VAEQYGVSGQNVVDVTVADNLIYQWPGSGITVAGADDVDVLHNTSYDSGARGSDNALTISEPGLRDGRTFSLNNRLTIADNAIEKLALASGASSPTTCTTNLVRTFSPSGASSACTRTDTSDPLFEGGTAYYLQSGSPAIGRADTSYPLPAGLGDVDETTRDATPDLGAREWHPLTDTLFGSGLLSGHTGEGSVRWALAAGDSGTASLADGLLSADAEGTISAYEASWTPADSTYAVETVVVDRAPGSGDFVGPVCRWGATGTRKNGYMGRIRDGVVELVKFDNGTSSILATRAAPTSYAGQPLKITLDCDGTKAVLIDDASYVTST